MTTGFFDTPSVPALWGSLVPLLALDICAIVLRFQTRKRLRQAFFIDDWLMIPSMVGVLGLSAMFFHGLRVKAFGYRWMLLPPEGVERLLDPDFVPSFAEPTHDRIVLTRRLEYSSLIIHSAVNGLIKLSVLLFYRRIFTVVPHWRDLRNLFFSSMMVLIGLWASSYVFAFLFMCGTEIQVLFTYPQEMAKRCVKTILLGYTYSISDFISDGLIILIPLPFIWRLHLPTKQKIGVMLVFLLGILAAGASLVRLSWTIWGQSKASSLETDEELMITYQLYWMQLEITLGLLAACLPTLRGLQKSVSFGSAIKNKRSLISLRSNSSNGVIRRPTMRSADSDGNYVAATITAHGKDTRMQGFATELEGAC